MDGATDDVNQAIAGELQLMDPRVRASRERAGQLLDPEAVAETAIEQYAYCPDGNDTASWANRWTRSGTWQFCWD
ncbi:hypothetical protein ACFC0D_28970 [Streptomyces sp. NPDC056222]|uniref:hypothetical protein n=1 Tax=Streptomyces sp. NPDC056222 TaxID=3345749 RepID=UPI0035D6ED27